MVNRMRSLLFIVPIALILAGCASSEFRASGRTALPPYEGTVERLSKLPATDTYQLIGIVLVRGVASTSDERMYEQLLETAAERGADAVVAQGAIRVRSTSDGGEERRLAAYAIRRR